MPTSVQQWGGAVFVGAVGPGAWPVGGVAVGVDIHHEVRLFPAVFLQRPTQLFVGPDQLQHLAGTSHLSARALAARVIKLFAGSARDKTHKRELTYTEVTLSNIFLYLQLFMNDFKNFCFV